MGSPVTWARYFLTKIRVSFAQGLRVISHSFFVHSCSEEWLLVTCPHVRLHYYGGMPLPEKMHYFYSSRDFGKLNVLLNFALFT